MKPTNEHIQTIKNLLEKEHSREFNQEEVQKVHQMVETIASWLIDHVDEQIRRDNLLKKFPKGFHFDQEGYNCSICGNSALGVNSWYDKHGLKCMTCQKAIDKRIIPSSVATKKESWYSKTELETYFNIKRPFLNSYIRQGLVKDRIIFNTEKKQHLQLFLIKDNKNFFPPKKLLRSRTVKVIRDGEGWYTSEYWYEYIDEKLAKKLSKYKVVECFSETFSQTINSGRFYHKGINPIFTYKH